MAFKFCYPENLKTIQLNPFIKIHKTINCLGTTASQKYQDTNPPCFIITNSFFQKRLTTSNTFHFALHRDTSQDKT